MGSTAAMLGAGAASAVYGFGSGILSGYLNNKWAAQREAAARQDNYEYGEMAADNADQRTRNLYADLYSPQAQMEQIKAAGLSPSIFYGDMAGISGQTGAQGTGAAGISPNTFGISPIDMSGIAKNMAEANLLKEEAESVKQKREPEMAKLLADAGYADAAAAMARLNTEGVKLDNYLKEHTMDANIYQTCMYANKTAEEAEKLYYEMRNANITANLNEELYNTNIEKGKQELELLLSTIRLNDQSKQKLRNDVLKSFAEIAQGWKQIDINEMQTESYVDWLNKRIPQINKELDIRLGELDLKNKEFVKDAILESIKAAAFTAVSIASFKGGAGSTSTPPPLPKTTRANGGHAIKEGVPIYKNDGLWAQ